MSDYIFVETVHINRFKTKDFDLESEDFKHLLDDCRVTPDGSILAVKREKVEELANSKEIRLTRLGYKPFPKSFDIKSDEDFWRCMAHLVDEEDLV